MHVHDLSICCVWLTISTLGSGCGGQLGQPTLVSVLLHSSIKQPQAVVSLLRLPYSDYLLVYEQCKQWRLHKGRIESSVVYWLIWQKCCFVKVLKLFSVLLPLVIALFGHDDKVLVVGKMLHKVAGKDFSNGRGKACFLRFGKKVVFPLDGGLFWCLVPLLL